VRGLSTLKDSYENVQVEVLDQVGLIRLHRPKALNALSDALFADLIHAARALDQKEEIGCLVLTGSTKAFAAGADISEMKDRTFDYTYQKVCPDKILLTVAIDRCPTHVSILLYRTR